jgi:ribosomal-protein-alanine N-acetyltransferase
MRIFAETQRLMLRELLPEDAQGLFELDSDPEVHRYLGNNPVTTIEQSKAVVEHVRQQYKDYGIGRWAIIDKTTNAFMGWGGLKYEFNHRKNERYYDLGYRILRKYWGNGIATESALESLKYGFNVLDVPEIFAAAHHDNAASNAILKKIGMQFVDTFIDDGAIHNWYALDKSSWLQARV